MNYTLTSKDKLTQLAKNKGINTWNELTTYVKSLPYGRNNNRFEFGLVFSEGKGTCSSKHALLKKIADLMGVEATTLDAAHGEEDVKKVAFIREDECIGCTKCIQACPVDAILGAAKQMHTVIVDECTGCDLCVEPCPVDCIDMVPVADEVSSWRWDLEAIPIKQVK